VSNHDKWRANNSICIHGGQTRRCPNCEVNALESDIKILHEIQGALEKVVAAARMWADGTEIDSFAWNQVCKSLAALDVRKSANRSLYGSK